MFDWVKKTFWLSQYNGELRPSAGENYSRKAVTQETALTLSAVWACVNLIAGSIASLPLGLYEKDKFGDKIDRSDEELYRILHDSPNADMTAFNFWRAVIAVLLLWGNTHLLKTYRGTGSKRALVSLELLMPDRMTWRKAEDGSIRYFYTKPKGGEVEYSEDEIMHLSGLTLDGRRGLSVIRALANTFGNAMSQEETSGRLYSNGMRPAGALKMPQILKQEQREEFRKNITDQVGGVSKTGGIIILEGGMEFQALSIPPEDAELLASRAFSIEEICRAFGVPPALIGHTEKTTTWGTGLEQINLGFLTYTLTPILKNIEQQLKRDTIPKGSRMYAEFVVEGFLRADSTGRANLYSSASQNGWMSRAEIRKKENLSYVPGTEELTVQSALVPLSMLGQPKESAVPKPTIEDSAKV